MRPLFFSQKHSRPPTAFSLVEILVSVTIVVILASLLIAPVKNSIAKAKQAKNMANIRQIGNALLLYRADNNDTGPADEFDSGNTGIGKWQRGKRLIIFGPLFPYLGIETKPLPSGTPAIFVSPASSKERLPVVSGEGTVETSYWMNPGVTLTANLRSAVIPGRRVAIVDFCKWWAPQPTDNHEGKGLHAFRMDGSVNWISSGNTVGLPGWDWSALDTVAEK